MVGFFFGYLFSVSLLLLWLKMVQRTKHTHTLKFNVNKNENWTEIQIDFYLQLKLISHFCTSRKVKTITQIVCVCWATLAKVVLFGHRQQWPTHNLPSELLLKTSAQKSIVTLWLRKQHTILLFYNWQITTTDSYNVSRILLFCFFLECKYTEQFFNTWIFRSHTNWLLGTIWQSFYFVVPS